MKTDKMLTTEQKRKYLQKVAAGGNGMVDGSIRECTAEEKQTSGQPQYLVYYDNCNYYVDTYEHALMIRSMLDGTHGLQV